MPLMTEVIPLFLSNHEWKWKTDQGSKNTNMSSGEELQAQQSHHEQTGEKGVLVKESWEIHFSCPSPCTANTINKGVTTLPTPTSNNQDQWNAAKYDDVAMGSVFLIFIMQDVTIICYCFTQNEFSLEIKDEDLICLTWSLFFIQ